MQLSQVEDKLLNCWIPLGPFMVYTILGRYSRMEISLSVTLSQENSGMPFSRILSAISTQGENTRSHQASSLLLMVWYNIFMSPLIKVDDDEYTVELKVYEGTVVNCVYPRTDLYPSTDFYPSFGNWNNLSSTGTED